MNWTTQRNLRKLAFTLALLALLVLVTVVTALTLNSTTPTWSNPVGTSGPVTCLTTLTVGAEQQIRFGDDDVDPGDCPADPNAQSGLGVEGTSTVVVFPSGEPFVLGELTHYNSSVIASSLLQTVDLNLNIDFGDPVYNDTYTTQLFLDETANFQNTCPFGDPQPCDDRITINRTSTPFNVGGVDYQFEILGMIPGTLGTCTYDQAQISTNFISEEGATNTACLFGRLTQVEEAQVVITKVTDPAGITSVAPGDILDYRIDYECSSIMSSCQGVEIVDFLPDGLVYVGSTGSIHTTLAQGVYSEDNNSVRFDFIDPLAAGSTGFVRVRVQVLQDGTLPDNAVLDNFAVSEMTNGPTNTDNYAVTVNAGNNWIVEKLDPGTVTLDTAAPATDVTYTVRICSNGSDVNLLNAQMVDTLPPGVTFVNASGGGVYDPGPPQIVTWDLGDLAYNSGCTSRTVTVRFPSPPFSDGQNVTNTVDGAGDPVGEPTWTDTDAVTNPLTTLVPNPQATIAKTSVQPGYVVGAEAQFRLNPRNTGNIPLQNFIVTDPIPPQLDVTRISIGTYANFDGQQVTVRYQTNLSGGFLIWPGSPFNDNNQIRTIADLSLGVGEYITAVQWDYGTVNPGFQPTGSGTQPRLYAVLISPDRNGDPVNDGDVITNNANLSYEFPLAGGGTGTGTETGGASLTVDTVPNPFFDKDSAGGINATYRFLIGQNVGYYRLDPYNNTGIALDNMTLTDTVPPQFDVTEVRSGGFNASGLTVTVSYSTNLGGPFVLGSSPSQTNATFNIPALGAGEFVTTVIWQISGPIPPEFRAVNLANRPRISGFVIDPDNQGNPVNDGDTISNSAEMAWEYLGIPDATTDVRSDTIREPAARPWVTKSTLTAGPYIPTSIVRYELRVGNEGGSPSALVNPIVVDLLPPSLQYMPGSWAWSDINSGLPAPVFEEIADYNGTGQTLLRWTFTGSVAQNTSGIIRFDAAILAGASEGTLDNTYGITTNAMPVIDGDPDVNDLDGDGDTNDSLRTDTTTISVEQLVGLDSVKGVRGALDTDFSVFPDTGRTLPNGPITYRLSIINQGNIPVQDVRVIDILPFVGDTGVRDLSPRMTEWRPFLTGLVAAPPNVTVYYSTSDNPCRPEVLASGPPGCTAPNWSLLPPADISTVQSLRFDFAGILNPGETFNFTWDMQAPPDAPEGAIAWNSFAFASTNAQTGIPLRPAEPNQVGIEIEIPAIGPLINLEKATNGQDADLPTGPTIPVGDPVTWTYVITNTGNTRLGSITLTDDILGPITCDEGPIPNLDPAESFTCTTTGVATAGQYTNIGTVVGTPVDASDVPLGVPDVSDTDPSNYIGFNPALARLGDRVWIDTNANGVQDGGEPGLPGVPVNLYRNDTGVLIDTVLTDGNGNYLFVDIDVTVTGTEYVVEFLPPAVYAFTQPDQGGDDTADSDADTGTGRTTVITLNAGDEDLTWDAGVVGLASLGDFVWRDDNVNGIQDPGEPPVENITVNLYDSTDTLVGSTTTNVDGNYGFTDLPPGDYYVEFVLPIGYVFTVQDANSNANDTVDSDADRTTGQTALTNLEAGENDPTWDAGIVLSASIGNFVWQDLDGDGRQDAGEPGVPGITVELYDSDDNLIGTDVTDGSGIYGFTDLLPGDYYLVFSDLPPSTIFSPNDVGTDDGDSDPDPATGRTTTTTLAAGETDLTWDAGLVTLASLGDYVWIDADGDGIQDGTEVGINGVTVTLFNGAGVQQAQTTTANNPVGGAPGYYLFADLAPGDYYVVFSNIPTGYEFSPQDQGGDDAVDSDANPATGQTVTTNLTPGENDVTWDAGLVPLASLGNFVWLDTNGNGIQDGGETGVPGVTVELLDLGNNVVATDTTDANGFYLFENLSPGSYAVRFSDLPAGYEFSPPDQGTDDALDSDPNPATGTTVVTTLAPGENDLTWDAGIYIPASLGDYVWEDTNADGIQDGTETGINGVTVTLFDSTDTQIATTTTANNPVGGAPGFYLFDNLVPGEYYVVFSDLPAGYEFSPQDQGTDDALDSDPDTTTGQTVTTTLESGENDLSWDAGIFQRASLGDYVWEDTNADGIQDGTETGINGVTVTLFDGAGVQQAQTTTANNPVGGAPGFYLFDNLVPGEYYVVFSDLPAGYEFSPQDQGGDDTVDSDPDTTTGQTATTTLVSGENDLSWDAGIFQRASLGDYVWEDTNADGIQDGTETGINGVTVTLFDSTDTQIAQTTTANNPVGGAPGFYLFDNLVPGEYYVVFSDLPAGYEFSPQDQGGDDTIDSDPDTTTGQTVTTTLDSGENDLNWDAGIFQRASLGDYVWEDTNADGIQDGSETGINGVTVTLFDGAGVQQAQTTTANNPVGGAPGFYLFDNLVPGEYYVVFSDLPAGYEFSPQDQGTDDALDSDPNPATGQTVTTTLDSGENDLSWDAGIFQRASLGDYVWVDTNADGIQDGTETGINGVTVTLFDGAGVQQAQTATANNPVGGAPGFYLFDNLVPGEYYVVFTLPVGYEFSPPDQGADDTADSDPDPTTGQTATTTLVSGENDLSWDAGIYQRASLGDYVWEDTNADGIQDGSETGINGVTVTLFDGAGVQQAQTTTANNPVGGAPGFYLFDNLVPGEYYVVFSDLPVGYEFSPQDQGGDDTIDSDPLTTTGQTATDDARIGRKRPELGCGYLPAGQPGRLCVGRHQRRWHPGRHGNGHQWRHGDAVRWRWRAAGADDDHEQSGGRRARFLPVR
jgi:uncharacterized repeat protein (TIGR01451 family)